MSVSGKLVLAIKMFLESREYSAALNTATKETEVAAARMEAAHNTTAKTATDAADKQIAALKKQIETFGLSAAELRRYQASMVDASESQRAEINKLLENLEALEAKSASNASVTARMAAQWSAAGAGAKVAAAGTAFLVVAAAAVGLAYHQAGQETLAFEKAIILTGNRAGVTSGQLADMARAIDGVAGTQANAAAALATMTATGQVARENLQKVSLAAVEMERATGQSIADTAKIFESLGDAPVKASARLNESMNYLTAGTYEQIKAAEELGDKETAASIAQNAFADAARQRAAGVEQNLGLVERAWRSAGDMAKWAWDRFVDIGRAQTADQQLKALQKQIAEKEKQLATTGFGENAGGAAFGRPSTAAQDRLKADIAALGAKAAALQGEAYQASEAANAERERAAAVKASIALSDEAGKRDSALEKTRKAVAQATQQYTTAIKNEGLTQQERAQIDANYLKVVSDLTKVKEKSAGASKTAASDAEKLAKAGAALTDSLLAQDSGLSGDFAKKWESLNAAYRAGEKSVEELTAAQAKLLSQQPLMKQAADEEAKATKELEKEREKALATLDKDLEKTLAAVAAQDEQNARLGLSKEAIAELDAAKLEMLATDMELQAANALFLNQDGEIYQALIKQANAYRDLARAKREGGAKQAGIDAAKEAEKEAKKASDEWERAGERIEQSLTDSLMRGFESGKDFAKNMRDTVVNMFKTMVLRPVISAVVNPVAGAITGALGLSGTANAATAGLSSLGSLGTIWNAGSSALSSIGSFLGFGGAAATGLGLTASAGAGLGLASAGGGLGLSLGGTGLGISAGSAGAGAIGGSLGSSLGAGAASSGSAMASIGAAMPWIAGAAAIMSIVSSLDDSGTYHTGGAAQYSAATGLRTSLGFRDNEEGLPSYNPRDNIDNQFGTGFGYVERGDQTISAVSTMAQALGTALDGVAVSFGQKAGYAVATAFADDTSKDGAWGALRISKEGKDLLNWQDTRTSRWAPKEFGDGEGGYKEYLAAVAKDTRQVLLDMDLPGWADTVLNAIGDSPSIDSLSAALTQIGQAQTVFKSFGQYMTTFATLADSSVTKLAAASGGIDALAGNMGVFVDQFYTDAEKLAVNTANVREALAKLGFEMPATRDEFKAMVQSQIALGDAGAQTTAGLLAVSGAVSAVLPPFEEAAAGVGEAMKRLQSDTAGLQIDLLRAQGNTTGADAAQRTLDTAGLTAAEISVYDYNQALRAQITALDAAAAAAAQQAEIRAGFERQLLELSGDTAALRALDIAGMDAANVALYDRVQALTASQAAEQAAAAAAQQQASTRAGLERQVLQLQGDTAALRLLDIAGMDAANVALYDRVQALQAEQATAQAAAAAAAQTAQQRYGLEGQLLQLQGNTVALRARELAALDPANRALQEQIWSLTDLQAAAQAAERAEQDLAATRSRVAQERYGLETQLLQLQGDTAALRARELAQIDPSNQALQQHVWALQDQAKAAQASSAAMGKSSDAFRSAANQAVSAWKLLTDSVVDEVRRIRGELAGSGEQSFAAAQMSFTIANASAAAGDQTAWEQLPQASRALLDAAKASAGSLLELQRIQAATAASMESTLGMRGIKVPAFASGGDHAGGWAMVGEQGPELAYLPPARIYTAQQTGAMLSDGRGNAELLAEIRQLNTRMARMEQHAERTRTSSELTARVLDDAARGKQPLATGASV